MDKPAFPHAGIGAGPPIGSNTGATERVSAQPTIQGIGSCTPPVPIGGGNDTFNVSCLSPAVSLKPGEVGKRHHWRAWTC